jgi:hypothetical protein
MDFLTVLTTQAYESTFYVITEIAGSLLEALHKQ